MNTHLTSFSALQDARWQAAGVVLASIRSQSASQARIWPAKAVNGPLKFERPEAK